MPESTVTPSELLGLKQICTRFSVSYSTVYDAVTDGSLPAEFARGRWRANPSDVVTWLRESDDFRTNQAS